MVERLGKWGKEEERGLRKGTQREDKDKRKRQKDNLKRRRA